ncbi:hypothetical protein A3Q56_05234 [Intoshia linei]|uniref:t-SNARE coiled-coil homology domain-containing protein n=1 Tax=Intoshia linei TaxID=1819745 RepID=A0A177B088_9BILA|nr:hypothetical protein A3Q56_05234 [Intoshia linei]
MKILNLVQVLIILIFVAYTQSISFDYWKKLVMGEDYPIDNSKISTHNPDKNVDKKNDDKTNKKQSNVDTKNEESLNLEKTVNTNKNNKTINESMASKVLAIITNVNGNSSEIVNKVERKIKEKLSGITEKIPKIKENAPQNATTLNKVDNIYRTLHYCLAGGGFLVLLVVFVISIVLNQKRSKFDKRHQDFYPIDIGNEIDSVSQSIDSTGSTQESCVINTEESLNQVKINNTTIKDKISNGNVTKIEKSLNKLKVVNTDKTDENKNKSITGNILDMVQKVVINNSEIVNKVEGKIIETFSDMKEKINTIKDNINNSNNKYILLHYCLAGGGFLILLVLFVISIVLNHIKSKFEKRQQDFYPINVDNQIDSASQLFDDTEESCVDNI